MTMTSNRQDGPNAAEAYFVLWVFIFAPMIFAVGVLAIPSLTAPAILAIAGPAVLLYRRAFPTPVAVTR